MAKSTTITLNDATAFKRKALQWAQNFGTVCLLDNNEYAANKYPAKNWVLAVDAVDFVTGNKNAFEQLKQFQAQAQSTIFGFLSYDFKNEIEKLESRNPDNVGFPAMYFFSPRYVFEITGNKLTLNRNYPETFEILELIEKYMPPPVHANTIAPHIHCSTGKDDYIKNVNRIKKQIAAGDYYELNYCLQFKAEDTFINPAETFIKLNNRAQAPFSCFFKLSDKYLLCASPERFLKKEGHQLISQPIKGTIQKGATPQQDEALKNQLLNDEKERAENVMIVDLVRNDLARSARPGTVKVEELFGIYGFNAVNQMISTVTATLRDDVDFSGAIKNAFPMGSMTGAPKIEVMKNIERYENFKRGLYSGSVGYIDSNGDFDLNVVIRSILYNAVTGFVSLPAGGAITFDSDPESEYNEVLLKAKGMMEVLKGD
jgi:para-aminobenzoate synthetase component I